MGTLFASAAATGAAKALTLLLTFGSLALTARELGPAGRGELAVATTYILMFATLGNMSLGQVALSRTQSAASTRWLRDTTAVMLPTALVVSAVAAAIFAWADRAGSGVNLPRLSELGWMCVGGVLLYVLANYSTYLLLADGRLLASNVAQIAGAACSLCILIVLVGQRRLDVGTALIAVIASQAVVVLTAIALLAGSRSGWGQSPRHAQPGLSATGLRAPRQGVSLLRDGLKLHPTTIGAFLFSSVDVLMVDYFCGHGEAGRFQLALQLFTPILVLPQALTDVLSSRLRLIGVRELWPSQRRILVLLICGSTLLAAVLAAAASEIVQLVGGGAFGPATGIFQIYMLGVPGAMLNGGMAIQWIGRARFAQISAITISAGVINIVANLLLIPPFGAAGAAWGTVIGIYLLPVPTNVAMWRRAQREAAVD